MKKVLTDMKKRYRYVFYMILAWLALFSIASVQAAPSGGVLFILDGSGSMWGQVEGKAKIAIAKEVMIKLVEELPDNVTPGLEVYGHRSKGDCNDIEVVVPLGKGNKKTLIDTIRAISPKGKTPITKSLELAAEQLRELEDETTVVLISDGKETCDADPCAMVKALREQGVKLRVHVVGFDVKSEERKQLMCIAEAGGGQYFSADNTRELTNALTEVRQQVVAAAQSKPQSSETTSKQKVIKIERPAVGTIEIINTHDNVKILDQQTGEEKGFVATSVRKPVQVPAGTYKLKFPNFVLEGIEVGPGEKQVIDVNTLFGWIVIPNTQDNVKILDQQTGEEKGFVATSVRKKPVQVPAGTYKLKFPNFVLEGIEVGPGEKQVIDVNTLFGWIAIPNTLTQDIVKILDQQTGEQKGYVAGRFGGTVQVPTGTYKLKFPNFTTDNIVVEPGQKVVIE